PWPQCGSGSTGSTFGPSACGPVGPDRASGDNDPFSRFRRKPRPHFPRILVSSRVSPHLSLFPPPADPRTKNLSTARLGQNGQKISTACSWKSGSCCVFMTDDEREWVVWRTWMLFVIEWNFAPQGRRSGGAFVGGDRALVDETTQLRRHTCSNED